MFRGLFGKGKVSEVERKAHFEQHLNEFETLVGRKFSDGPKIEALQKEAVVDIRAHSEAEFFLRSYSIMCGKKPELKTLQSFYESSYREILREKIQGHLFDYDTNTVQVVSSAPQNMDLQMFWFQLGKALLYDSDRAFGPPQKGIRMEEGAKNFLRDAFANGFAGYCSDLLANAKGIEKLYDYDRQGPLNYKKLEDEYLIAIEKVVDIREKAQASRSGAEKEKLVYEFIGEYNKVLMLNPLVGFAYVDNIIYLKSAEIHGATPEMLIAKLLSKKKPGSIDDLFFYNREIPEIDIRGVENVLRQIHDSRKKSGDKSPNK